jgi:serine/threonine protein phosphatase PrpC
MDGLLSIGEFSTRSGLSAKRLRSYAAAGLLVPAAVDASSGYRYYAPGQIHDARVIEVLRRAKIPVAEIAIFLKAPTVEQLERWTEQIDAEARHRHSALATARELVALDERQDTRTEHRTEPGGMDMITLSFGAATETGARESNEDTIFADGALAAVADGLGGHAAGQIASRTAIEAFRTTFRGASLDDLEQAARAANDAVWDQASQNSSLEGMGTTLCAIGTIEGPALGVVSVGDSRAYLLRDGSLTQLTADHNVVSEMVARGELTPADAADHEFRFVLTRALGVAPTVEADTSVVSPKQGDRLLLCTDGLVHELTDDEITTLLAADDDPKRAARHLVDEAISRDARDNVSVVVVDVA